MHFSTINFMAEILGLNNLFSAAARSSFTNICSSFVSLIFAG